MTAGERLDQARALLDLGAGLSVVEILDALGAFPPDGAPAAPADAMVRAGILPSYRRLFDLLLSFAQEDGFVAVDGDGLRLLPHGLQPGAGHDVLTSGATLFPELGGELDLLQRCLEAYPSILTGRADPLAVLFPNGSMSHLQRLYRDASHAQVTGRLVADAVAAHLASAPLDAPIRVVEVGAGTGGTTAAVLPTLTARGGPGPIEYLYTDISEAFLQLGRDTFGQHEIVRFARFDMEMAPEEQGMVAGRADVVLAAHVLHTARDLNAALEHLRELLRPGGVAVLVETHEPRQRWANLVFGLTDGWWRFDGTDGRNGTPLLVADDWLRRLESHGFCEARVVPAAGPAGLACRSAWWSRAPPPDTAAGATGPA